MVVTGGGVGGRFDHRDSWDLETVGFSRGKLSIPDKAAATHSTFCLKKFFLFKKCESGVPPDGCMEFSRRILRRMTLSLVKQV